jgi:soluble lytic murein transglycosylase-like protein
MSAQALSGAAAGMPSDELAVAQRVQQIQALVEQARQTSSAVPDAASGSFAATLQAATAAGSSGGQYAAMAGATGEAPYSSGLSGAPGSSQYDSLINQAAARYGLDPAILHGLIQQESGFDPNATSSAGAVGLTQLMPSTAASLGVTNPLDPTQSIEGGARYLSQMMAQFGGNTSDALAAYNAGAGAVQRYGGVPPYAETQGYVAKVLANAEAFRQAPAGTTTTEGLV